MTDIESICFYREYIIKIIYFDTANYHYYIYESNRKIRDSLGLPGYEHNEETLFYAKQTIDFMLDTDD